MTNTVTLNGNTYDDSNAGPNRYMGNGGHRSYLIPMLSDAVVDLAAKQSACATSETNASTSATNASNSATAAANSAASATSAPGTSATSTTSLTVGAGSQSLTINTGKSLTAGQWVSIARTSDPNNTQMRGSITSYNSTTGALVVSVAAGDYLGSGTFTDWTVSVQGATGATGANGSLKWVGGGDISTPFNIYFLSIFDGTADNYHVKLSGCGVSLTDNVALRLAVAGAGDSGSHYFSVPLNGSGSTATTFAQVVVNIDAAGSFNLEFDILNVNDSTNHKTIISNCTNRTNSTPTFENSDKCFAYNNAAVVTGFYLYLTGGNTFVGGHLDIYKYLKS